MLARYREVVSTVLGYTRSNEKLIRRAVIQMLPRLAAFAPERFARMHLQPCTTYLLSVLRNPPERGAGAHPSESPAHFAWSISTCSEIQQAAGY